MKGGLKSPESVRAVKEESGGVVDSIVGSILTCLCKIEPRNPAIFRSSACSVNTTEVFRHYPCGVAAIIDGTRSGGCWCCCHKACGDGRRNYTNDCRTVEADPVFHNFTSSVLVEFAIRENRDRIDFLVT
ncbi:hypothetical protein J8N05_14650 [Streptomyces sp. BH-SS-21]|uniref:Uncharacterized protein n=1 Tax=Streptomyces liliiviolaceus TaxID=2823109 RepID=A0A940XXC0_9ACTN|nr:hypothetical protein [Streptomyces liliiviolaceus]MBQ0849442.1 hypothetical protein [Streptomyces liliiviolaceus]